MFVDTLPLGLNLPPQLVPIRPERSRAVHVFQAPGEAIAPILDADSINKFVAFKADRFGKGQRDYYNCPLNKEEYEAFIEALKMGD